MALRDGSGLGPSHGPLSTSDALELALVARLGMCLPLYDLHNWSASVRSLAKRLHKETWLIVVRVHGILEQRDQMRLKQVALHALAGQHQLTRSEWQGRKDRRQKHHSLRGWRCTVAHDAMAATEVATMVAILLLRSFFVFRFDLITVSRNLGVPKEFPESYVVWRQRESDGGEAK